MCDLVEGSVSHCHGWMNREIDLRDVQVVSDFPDVFPYDVPELPPVRDIELSIDSVLDRGSISIPPYQMSPSELAELKEQLENLVSKQFFIRQVFHRGELQCC